MLDESIQSLVAQINEGAVSPSSVMPSSDSPEPTIESAAPPTPPEETNEQRAYRLAKKHGVDPKLVISMMAQESGGKTKARSWKDARGPMQLMPETAKALGVTDIYDPEQNIEAGVKYLKYGLDKYGRTPDGIKKAIAGYNLGMDKKVLRDPDWWNKISKYSNTEGITGTPMSNPARGLHDRGSTGNYVKNIWSNYMKGGAPTVMNYSISDETVKLAKKLFGTQKPSKAADPVMKDDSAWASGKPVFDPSEQNLGISDETANLAKQLFGGSEYDQYLAQTGQVANPSGQTEYDGLPLIGGRKPTTRVPKTQPVTKEPTLADVNKSLKAEGKKPITQEQLTKQVKENESFGSDVTVGYSGGTPVDDSGDPLPVPIDGPIEVKTDEDILANGTRTIKMDPDTDKDQAFDNALHSIGAEYDLPSSQVEGFIAKRRAAGKTVQYDLTTEERAALKASGKQMGVTVDYGTINDLLNFGRTEPDKIHPKLRQTVDMYTAENRAPKIDLNLPEMNEPKGFINKLRGISPEQERTENMQSDPLYQQAKDNLYREKGFEPNRTLEGSYDLLGAPALDEREIQDEYMRLQSTEKLLDEEAIRRGQERGDTMGASEGGWAGSFSAGLNTSAGLVQVLNQLGGGGAENNVTRYLRRLGKETGAAASVESEKNTGGWDTVNRFITGLPIGLTKAMMLVPTANGSTSIAFGIEAGLGESGRGGTGTDVLRESGKGYLMGTLFPVGRKLGSIAGGGKAGALVDIGTVTAGTAAISGAGGASPEEAGKAGIENAILDVLMRVARMRKSGGKWYDSGEADLDSVKNKIYRYTPNPREIGIVDGGLTRAANIAGVPENHVYFTVKADGSVVVINQPPPKTKVTYIKKAPTQAELESMLRKQVEALGKETTQPSQAGPAMSEPIRSVVPIPGSEPRVVNAEPIPKIVMGQRFSDSPKGGLKPITENGKEITVYHGTSVEKGTDLSTLKDPLGRGSVFFTVDPNQAGELGASGIPGKDQVLVTATISANKLWDFRDPEAIAAAKEAFPDGISGANGHFTIKDLEYGNWEAIESSEFSNFLKKNGYDAFTLTQDGGTLNYGVVSPKQVRITSVENKSAPIPESQSAIDAQTAAAADPSQTKRIAVMFPKGTKPQHDPATQWKIVNSKGDVIVVDKEGWKAKAAELGVKPTKSALVEYTKAGKNEVAVQDLLGRPESAVVESTEATPGRAAVEVTQDGTQIDATVVDTEQAAAETVDSMEQQYPDATVEVRDSTEVAENRLADTGLSPVDRFEQQAGRSATSAELGQILEGKTPEEILAGPVTKLPPRQETQISMLIDRFKQETGREPTESELFQMSMGDHPDGIIARAKAGGSPVGAYHPGDTVIYTDKKGNQLKAEVVRDNDSLAQTRIRLYKKDGTIGTREVKVGHADIERVDTPDAPKLSGAIVPEILPPEISQPKVETKVNQEPAKVEPESKPVEQPKHRHDEAIAEHKSDIEFNEDQMLAEQENIEMIEGDIPEARAARDAEIKKIRASKLPKEAKEDAIEDAKGKYQDIKDDTESQIEGHKEEISAYKKEIAKSKRKLAKLETERSKELAEPSSESPKAEDTSDTRDPIHVQSDADLAEYMATRTVSDEPHVGMLNSGIEVQLEAYIRPATKDGVQLKNKQGEPLLEGSLVQTRTSNGESSYIGDRVLGTDRADILRQVDNKRLEYQHEHGQEGTFIPKSEVPEKVALVDKKVSELVEGDEVMTPDGLGEFISRKGRTVMVEVGGVEKPYLETLVKPTDATEVKVKDTIYNSSGLAGEVVKINDGYVQVQWKDANGKPLGHPVEVKTSNVLVNKPEAKVPADDDLVEMGVGFSFLKKILGLRNRNDSINTLNSLTADAEIAAARETMGKSNGLESSTLLGRMRESAIGVYNGFKRTFININPNKSPEMAVSNDILRQQLAAPAAARGIVTMQIGNITKNLGPQRLQLFTENLLLNDLAKDVEAGKYSNKPLPFGLTPEVLERMLVENEALVAINPEIQDAIVRRQSYVDGITNQLVAYDLLGPEVLSDPRYFHRQVLEYMNEKTYTGTNMSGDLRDRTKGFQRGRTGSSRDYNTNYAEAEFEWLSQAQALILRRQGRDRLQQVNDMKPALDLAARVESTAQGVPVSFREFIPDTHVLWQPKKGNFFYEAFPMAERMLNRLVDGEAELTEINGDYFLEYENNAGDTVSSKVSPRQVLGGRRPEWVIPKNLAAELDNFNAIDTMNPMENVWTSGQNAWKQWTLLNPAKTLVYNLNNMSGDLDITLAYDPSILKYFPGAAKDSWNFSVRGRDGGQDIESALKLGVIDSGLTVAEIPDIQTQTAFKGLSNNDSAGLMKAVGTFWDTTKNLTNGRENILRLAAFRYFKDKLAAGENVYGASNPEQINAIRRELGDEAAAAKLSRELVGDYGAVSVSGRWIRRHMIPFYSWIEINAPRYVKMLKNTTKEDGAQAGYGRYARATGVGAVKTALNVTKFAAKAGLFAAAASMYNRTAFPDEDKELRRQGDRNYIILGRRADGSIRSLKLAGALKDMLEWGGLEDLPRDIDEMIAGDRTIKDELIEVPKAAVNKLVQSLEPVTKTMYELIMGEQVYPTIFPPKSEMGLVSRPIRDRAAHIARTLSSKALYDAGYYVYAKLTGRPEMPTRPWTAGDTLGKVLDATIAYRMDPNETMFWSIKGDSIDWAKKNGKEMPAMDPTEKSNALFYYKQGLKIGDQKAAEQWRQEYLNLGGTEEGLKSSIDKAHPLASLSSDKEKLEYVKQLTPEKKQQLKQALAYYHGIYLLGGEGDDKTSEELFAKMMIQIEGGELSSRRKEEEKASLESRVAAALESRKMGNDTLFNQLPTAERNKVLLKENTSDEIEDFSRADATEKLYVFKNSPVEDQASMAAFIRKLSGQLYKQSLPAKRKGQSKKPLSREDQVLLKEMQEALKQYEGLKKGLPADVVKKLKEAELTSTKALPPVKPKARKKHY